MINFERELRLAIVISHPIQHFCPQYASYAKIPGVKLKVFFGSRLGVDSYNDPQFQTSIKWDNLYLEEFEHTFLNNVVLPSNKDLDSNSLENELIEYNPDFVITYGYFQKLQKRAVKWCNQNKKKIIYISDSELFRKRIFGLTQLKRFFLNHYFRKIDAFLTVGDANESYYEYYKVPLKKMFRNSFPIDVQTFEDANRLAESIKIRFLREYKIKDDSIIISTVGKLIDFKRHIDVIHALHFLEKNHSNVQIVYFIIGDGPERKQLEAAAQKLEAHKVVFTGFVKPQQLPDFYISSDIYVHPSETEAHSLAISEAIFSGCPIIVSDMCGSYGPTDDVQQGLNGFVYEVGNVLQLAKYIERLINHSSLREEFSNASKAIGLTNQKLAHGTGLLKALKTIEV